MTSPTPTCRRTPATTCRRANPTTIVMPRRGGGWSRSNSAAATSPTPRCWRSMGRVARERFVPAELRQPGVQRPSAADRAGPDDLAAVHRGADDPACPAHARKPRPGGRRRLGLSDGHPRRACAGRSTASRSSSRWPTRRAGGWPRWATGTSPSAAATATRAGPNTPPST